MEIAKKEKWSEEVCEEVEEDCELNMKRRSRPRSRNGEDSAMDGDFLSFSVDGELGTKLFSSDDALKSAETEFTFAEKNFENRSSTFTEIWNDLQSVPNSGENHDYGHNNLGNGSNLCIGSAKNVEDEVVASTEPETQSHGDHEVANTFKLDVSELASGSKLFSSDGALKSAETEFTFAEKKFENGRSTFTEIWNDLQSVPNSGENHDYVHNNLGNGSNLCIDSAKNVEDEVVTSTEPETQSHGDHEAANTFKLDVSELDLEKLVEEQETHDLFCPNCHSCITKRVILRKRKRRVRDFQFEERPEKLQTRPDIAATSTEVAETIHENEPEVFRCLSCFSFFSPTENGFSIFRIFRKRDASVNVEVPNIQSSGPTSTADGNWLSSIFKKPSSSKKKGDEADADLLQPQLDVSFGGDHNLEGTSALPIPAPIKAEDSSASKGKLHSAAAQYPVVIEVSSGGDQSLNEDKNALTLPISVPATVGQNYPTIKINSDDDDIIPVIINKPSKSGGIDQNNHDIGIIPPATVFLPHDDDMIKPVIVVEPSSQETSQNDLSINISAAQSTVFLPLGGDVQITVSNPMLVEPRREDEWEVLKSIVYGGLIESITSLGVISSAAGAKTSTLNVIALGLANLVGGFFVMLHDLSELKSSPPVNQHDEHTSRYWKLLGKKSNFSLHATVAIISYIFFGLLPPIIYGFSFRERDIKEDKLIAVASSSLLCVALLSIGKAHVSERKSYIKTFLYYIGLGFSASGLSFVAGVLIHRFLDQIGLFEHENPPLPVPPPSSISFLRIFSGLNPWGSQ